MENEHRLLKERLNKTQALLEELQNVLLQENIENEDRIAAQDQGGNGRQLRRQALQLTGEALDEFSEIKPRFEHISKVNGGRWRALFQELFENSTHALLLTDANGLILLCNAAAARFLGQAPERIIGKPFVTLVTRDDQRALHKLLARLRLMSHVAQEETIFNFRMVGEGTSASSCAAVARSCWLDKTESEVFWHFRDGGSELEAKEEIARLNEELRMQFLNLAAARSEAVEKARAKTQFLANMSHEFRTPLNAVVGLSEIMLTSPLSAEQADWARNIEESAKIILDLVENLFELSQMEVGQFSINKADFDITSSIEDTVAILSEVARQKDLSLMCYLDSRLPREMLGDVLRLRQVLLNLLSNALKFTTKGEVTLRVAVDIACEKIRFAISDTGPGFSQADMDRLFKPFSQLDSSNTRNHGGSGLGLFISRNLVELMGGKIGAFSNGTGATFWFTLPLNPLKIRNAVRKIVAPHDHSLLVISKLPLCRNLLLRYLKDWGLRAVGASQREEALAFLDTSVCQIAIIDLDTLDFALKSAEVDGFKLPALHKVIFIGKTPEVANATAPSGCHYRYLPKPVRSERLYECLVELIGLASIGEAISYS
jgi:PAS domain S-box-containing protein